MDVNILGAVAKLSDIKESADLREMLLEEKLRENAIREELARYSQCWQICQILWRSNSALD